MRGRVRTILVTTTVAVLLSACATGSANRTGSQLPIAHPTTGHFAATVGSAAGYPATPIDVGLARLWLPTGWRLVSDWCAPWMKVLCTFMPPCPGANDTIYVASWPQALACRTAVTQTDSVWIAPRRVGSGPATWRKPTGPSSVIVQVPALGVTIEGFGRTGVRVAQRFGPSTLRDLLAAKLLVAVPHGWRRAHYGTLSVEVPLRWPVQQLSGSRYMDPGACGGGYFSSPGAVTGYSLVTPMCPMISPDEALAMHSHPCNGVWLQLAGNFLNPSREVARRLHGIRIDLRPSASYMGSNSVQVVVHADGRIGDLVLGLGTTAGVAEAILSSLRV